jgi:4a-hydroxytetrahydrobiopterin dehydratase
MKLNPTDLNTQLAGLPDWTVVDGKLHREYRFQDFGQAIGFMTMAALKIETLDHHPEWANVYNRVSVDLVTHSAGGITMKDFALAAVLDKVARQFS